MATRRWGEFLLHLRWRAGGPAGPPAADGALLRRFAEGRDEAAFALLVERHGPTVFGVCCRVLGPGPDAEDAFQATFVVLARKAAALADREVVGDWLFGVARRTALKARTLAARRRAKEREMARPESRSPADPGELREAIDVAVARLPTKYRVPVVLCELEGRSLREAAVELGWPEGTVAGRLSRGRAMLRARLVRAGLPAAAGVAAIPVPAALAAAAVRAACAAGGGARALPPAVAILAAGVQRQIALARLLPIVAVLGVVLATAGAVAWTGAGPDPPARLTGPVAADPGVPRRPAVDALGEPLPAGALARLGDSRLRHGGQLRALAFTADGTGLVGGGEQWANHVWDVASGRHRRIVTADRVTSSAVALARDGSRLAACTDTTTCVVWDTATGQDIRRLVLPRSASRAMALSPDGRVAVSTGETVVLYAPDGAVERELATPGGPAALVFSADGFRLAAAQFDGSTLVFHVATGVAVNRLAAEPNALTAAFSPAGDALVVGTNRGIHVFDLRTGARVWRRTPGAPALAMAPDGGLLATADYDGRVRLWDWRSGTVVRDVVANEGTRALAFAPDGATLAIGGASQVVRLFDTATGRERHPSSAPAASAHNVGLTPDGRRIVTSAPDGFQVWDPATARRLNRIDARLFANALTLAMSPDGRHVAGCEEGRVRTWDLNTGRVVSACDGPPGQALGLAYSADGSALAAIFNSQDLRVWDPATGKTRAVLTRPGKTPRALAFADDGPELAVSYSDRSLAVWDVSRAAVVRTAWGDRSGVHGLAYSARRKVLAIVTDTRVGLRDSETLAERWAFARSSVPWYPAVVFSPDGRWLAYPDDLAVYLVDAQTGRVARTYRGHGAAVTGLAFAPDSDRLYSASLDTTVLVWAVGPPAP